MGSAMLAKLRCERYGRSSLVRPKTRSSPKRMRSYPATGPASDGASSGPAMTDRRVTFVESMSFGSATGLCGRSSPTSRAERPPFGSLDQKDRHTAIPLRNDENQVCSRSAQPPGAPVGRSPYGALVPLWSAHPYGLVSEPHGWVVVSCGPRDAGIPIGMVAD